MFLLDEFLSWPHKSAFDQRISDANCLEGLQYFITGSIVSTVMYFYHKMKNNQGNIKILMIAYPFVLYFGLKKFSSKTPYSISVLSYFKIYNLRYKGTNQLMNIVQY